MSNPQTEVFAVNAVEAHFLALGHSFRRQIELDAGVDAHAEAGFGKDSTGQLLALQIKGGKHWFKEQTADHIVYRPKSERHVPYWLAVSVQAPAKTDGGFSPAAAA